MGIWFPIQILFNIWLSWHHEFLPSILNSKHPAFHHYHASTSLVMVTASQQSDTKYRNVKPSGSFNTGKLWQVETLYLSISKYFHTTRWIEWHSLRKWKCFGRKVQEGKSHYIHTSTKTKNRRKNQNQRQSIVINNSQILQKRQNGKALYRIWLFSVK